MFKALRQLTSSLLGNSPSKGPAAKQPSSAPSSAQAALQKARSMRIKRVVRQTPDAVALYLEELEGAPLPTFHPGQFLNVCVELNGEPVWRSYSICAAPHSGELAIAVKRVEGGRVSSYLNAEAKEGQLLTVRGPSGAFLLPERTAARRVLLVAGGSGITPLISQAKHLLHSEPDAQVTLLYGNRSLQDIIFHEELRALSESYAGRLTIRHVLSTPCADFECGQGMLDEATARAELTRLMVLEQPCAAHMLCGPEPMMNAVRAALLGLGVPEATIREERFTAAKANTARSTPGAGQEVSLQTGAGEHVVQTAAEETILDAALRNKVPLDFSCTVGMCGTCIGRLRQGSVEMEEPNCLTDEQRAQGFILPCVSRPKAPCTVEFGQ